MATSDGRTLAYDSLVLATGSYAAVPPVPGTDLRGASSTARIDDVADLRAYVEALRTEHDRPLRGAVVGGGLLGLEAAGALQALEVETHGRRVRAAADAAAGRRRAAARRCADSSRGWASPCGPGRATIEDRRPPTGGVARMEFADGPALDVDVVVFAVGVRAARRARPGGRAGGRRARRRRRRRRLPHRGPERLGRSARSPASRAAASASSRPATRWPRSSPTGCSAARRPSPAPTSRPSSSSSASTSRASATRSRRTPGAPRGRLLRPGRRRLQEARAVATTRRTLLGGILVGDAAAYAALRPMVGPRARRRPGGVPPARRAGAGARRRAARRRGRLLLQQRHGGRRSAARSPTAAAPTSPASRPARRRAPAAAPACPLVKKLVTTELARSGVERQQRAVRALRPVAGPSSSTSCACRGSRTFSEIIARYGTRARLRHLQARRSRSILASLGTGHILDGERATPAGHQRPRDGEPAEGRHLLRGPAHPRRRDHARGAARHRPGRQGLRAVHEDHRRPADRPLRRAARAAADDLEAARRRRASSPATPTASRCAP